MRAGIAEDDGSDVALREARARRSSEIVADPDERALRRAAARASARPRRAQRSATRRTSSRPGGCSSSGWPTTSPRARVRGSAVGRRGLLDFVEHLLDWSRDHPIFMLALARPELAERPRPGAPASATSRSLYLEPLAGRDGRAPRRARPGPARRAARPDPRARRGRAAVRGRDGADAARPRPPRAATGDEYRPAGADRDARGPGDAPRARRRAARRRSAGRAAAAAGRRGARQDLHARRWPRSPASAERTARAAPRSHSCARRCSTIQADPLSPERGQYVFLQDSLQRVAYETLSMRERKARHLAAAGTARCAGRRGRDRRGDRRPLPRRLPSGTE